MEPATLLRTIVFAGFVLAAITVSIVQGGCTDAINNCSAYAEGTCKKYSAWAKQKCAKTCKYCGVPPEEGPHCTFNDRKHADGSTWFEGCKAKCGCHLERGKFPIQCNALCWDYDIPASCSWDPPKPGKCCRTPNCPPGVKVTYPKGYDYWGEGKDAKLNP